MKCMGKISSYYNEASFDASPFKEIILKSFTDIAFEVRQESCRQIPALVKSFGEVYVFDHFIDSISQHYQTSKNYHFRVTLFHAIEHFSYVPGSRNFNSKFSELLLQGLKDAVVNIRLLVCQTIEICSPKLKSSDLRKTLISELRKLSENDADPDVIYFSIQAANSLE